jgi:photosystem II stability/assembly factor-like uncharacterized protein
MADVQFDISMHNTGSSTQGLTLFAPSLAASQKASKYSFSTPYFSIYPAGTVFTITDDNGDSLITLTSAISMSEVVVLLNGLNVGTFSIAYNDIGNGNIFYLLSMRNPLSLAIDNNTIIGVFVAVIVLGSRNTESDCLISSAIIIISGQNGEIYYSTDLGSNWNTISLPSGTGYYISQLSYASGRYFVIGTDLTNSRTWYSDDGITWNIIQTYALGVYFGLKMIDQNNGFVYGSNGINYIIAKTSNGLNSLSTIQITTLPNTTGRIQFVDALNGFIFVSNTNRYYYTFDGGLTWTLSGLCPVNIYGGFALNSNYVVIVGVSGNVRYTVNKGVNWTYIGFTTANILYNVYAFDTQHIIVGRQGRQYTETFNGGSSWTNHNMGAGASMTKIFFSGSFGVAFDDDTIYKWQ